MKEWKHWNSGEALSGLFLTNFSGSLSQFALVRWVDEGEDALVLFNWVHSSVEAMQRLEGGRV